MTKNIDLNKTWCEATEENYKSIGNKYLKNPSADVVYVFNGKSLTMNSTWYYKHNFDTSNYRQIHLVNGEFQYVESKPKNNFKEYGFEADFEGEILSDIEDYYIGYYIETYPCVKEKQKIPTFWNKNTGNCYKGAGVSNSKYSLKPIKKEWYENSDNIGKFISINNTLGIFKSYAKENETIIYINLVNNLECIIHISKCRPATQEEVLALLIKE